MSELLMNSEEIKRFYFLLPTDLNCQAIAILSWKLFWQISYCNDTLLNGVPNS